MGKITNLITTPVAGFISAPFVLVIFFLYAFMLGTGWTQLAQPIAELYGHTLPTIPGYQWLAAVTLFTMVGQLWHKQNKPIEDQEKTWKMFISRVAGIFALIFSAYIINWIWL